MSNLFEQTAINGMSLANRFVRSATWEALATASGECTPALIDLMTGLAKGGVGLIISGHAYVRPEGQAGPAQLGAYKDELLPGLSQMTSAVHKNGGKIVLQLAHAGGVAAAELSGKTPLAPSPMEGAAESTCREMTPADIQDVAGAFAAGAQRAQKAGFDGVQIHAAHGYLFSQFLSPFFNRRQDRYGGSIQNRAGALLQALRAVRQVVGKSYPVLVKMNCQDFNADGLSLADALQTAVMLAEEGIDALELSGGNQKSGRLGPVRSGIKSEDQEAYFQSEARTFKEKINIPLILVGGNRSLQVAERLVNEGVADYISLSRPLIREPALINRWKAGDLRRAACVSDNLCHAEAREGRGIYCVTEAREKRR